VAHAQFTLDVRTGPVTRPPGEFEILPQKGSKGVVVQVPGKAALVRGILESSDDEDDDDDDMEESTPFTAEDIQKMKQKELRSNLCKYKLGSRTKTPELWNSVSKMREALMTNFGLEGSTASDWEQKREETRNAMAKFLLLPIVVAITSKIPDFNPKNPRHAELFMKDYRKKHGEGPTRSRKST
jgi:hypothetical protein